MGNKKVIVIAILTVLVVTLAIISLVAGKTRRQPRQSGGQVVPTVARKRLPTKFDLPQPKSISWNFRETDRAKTMDELAIEKVEINLQMMKKMLAIVNLTEGQKTSETDGLIMFGDGQNRSAYFDVFNNKFSYSEAINSRDQITEKGEPVAGNWEQQIKETMELVGVEIKIVSREYKKIINPRWVTTTEDEAEATEIKANYYWGDYPLLGFTGEPIKVLVSRNGKILKMEVEIIGQVTTSKKIELMTTDDLRKLGADEVWLWKVDGDTENESVGAVTITGVNLGYVYNPEGVVDIYWIGEGSGVLESKPVKVSVITPAR